MHLSEGPAGQAGWCHFSRHMIRHNIIFLIELERISVYLSSMYVNEAVLILKE